MHRAGLLLVVATGCRSLLGIDEVVVIDGPVAPSDADLDAAGDVIDATYCYGAGLISVCLPTPPVSPRTFADSTIDAEKAAV